MKNTKKEYIYEIYISKDYTRKLRPLNLRKDYDFLDLYFSKKTPQEIKQIQSFYNKGLKGLGDKTGAEDYIQTIE
jgi:hypothetical protein